MSIHLERPLITEIQVRMDCNGCVQKIRRALQTLQGIYDVYIDFPQQKVTVVGWVDPDLIMKAIKKAGKRAKLCSHVRDEETADRADPAAASSSDPTTVTEQPADQTTETVTEQNAGDQPPPAPENEPAAEAPAAPADAPPPENADQPAPTDPAAENPTPDPVPIPHDHPIYGFLSRNGLDGYQVAQEHMREADYHYANEYYTRPYNVPEYADTQRRYNRRYMGGEQYYYNNGVPRQTAADGTRFTSMFSDENPNACSIT